MAALAKLAPEHLKALRAALEIRMAENGLKLYKPYRRQEDFHAAGAHYRERLFRAGNQLGKTKAAAAEIAFHVTGRYPTWWKGKVFHRANVGVVASETGLLTRDGMQAHLFGWPKYPLGHGMVPKDAIIETSAGRGINGLFDYVRVRFGGGADVQSNDSMIYLRSYDQGRQRIQAMTLDWFALDEEPPIDYYIEALTRTNSTLGPVWLTFTPLLGMSDVVARFLTDRTPGTIDINMTIDDVDHYTQEQKQAIINSYPLHERDARAKGIPILGSGRVFPVDEAQIKVDAFALPAHWPRICGLDFGWDHPSAAVWIAWDRDTDTFYVYDCHRQKEQPVVVHAAAVKARGEWIPVAWPHDGNNDLAAGPNLASQYRNLGVAMLPEHATLPEMPGGHGENTVKSRTSVEAGIAWMLGKMLSGQFKVFAHLNDWWEEFRLYHRKDGKIVKERDDLMAATRYGFVMHRVAKTKPVNSGYTARRPVNWRV